MDAAGLDRELDQEVVIVRIYLHEADHGQHKNLTQEILNVLQKEHEVRGVTVFRGSPGSMRRARSAPPICCR